MEPLSFDIDLDLEPRLRWEPLAPLATRARALLAEHARELLGGQLPDPSLLTAARHIVGAEVAADLDAIAVVLRSDPVALWTANLYYDLLKLVFGGITMQHMAFEPRSGAVHVRLPRTV